jgi:hypothetical protein
MITPAAGEYRDRTTGLIVFGILEILLGALFLLLMALMGLGLAFASRHGGAAVTPRAIIPAVGIYGVGGTILIWLGIGSILARRWARALWVCLSGVGFAMGVLCVPFVVYITKVELPRTMAANGGPGQPVAHMVQIIMLGFLLLFYLIIPGTLFLFYRSVHVKRTCEVRDPKERWTDRCPLPVLALSLFTAFGGCFFLALLPFLAVFPVFGILVTGVTGGILMLAYAGATLYVAWGLYRLKIGSWRLLLGLMVVMTLSGTITLWNADLRELYMNAGFDLPSATQASELAHRMKWMGGLWFLPWLGWALYVRRYFPKASVNGAKV